MRILLWHGYLLTGSGSNLYTANIARVWRRQGHEVLLMCQERNAAAVPFVDAYGSFDASNSDWEATATKAQRAEGTCTVARPEIGDVLPVYVYDEYEGFTAKLFVDLSEEELDRYVRSNVSAMRAAIERFSPDAIITGHEVMGPYIALEACRETGMGYLAKLHGSALEYAVKKQARYAEYARLGLGGAKVVTGGSRYMVREAALVVPGWEERAEVVNPGCDVELFRPTETKDEFPTVGYVGKFIPQKGVHNLIAALGLTASRPTRAVIVGYGGFQRELVDLWKALFSGDLEKARQVASTDATGALASALEALGAAADEAGYRNRMAEIRWEWPGRLEHDPLARVLPGFTTLVVPSVLAEAFGMVGAEAAACGVLPIVPRHSGIGEVGAAVEEAVGRPGLLTYDPAEPVQGIAASVDRVLDLSEIERSEMAELAVSLAREIWSWEHVAGRLLELASR